MCKLYAHERSSYRHTNGRRPVSSTRTLIFFVNDARFFLSHRLALALAAPSRGFHPIVVCPPSDHVSDLLDRNIEWQPIDLPRGRVQPWKEWKAIREFGDLVDRLSPDLVHCITSKPILYGGIVTRARKIPAIAAISGLGHVFISQSAKARLLRLGASIGYRLSIRRRGMFPIFQNENDMAILRGLGALCEEPTLVPGSGTRLDDFDPRPALNETPRIVLNARMLESKGVYEFVKAARILARREVQAEMVLAGDTDSANPRAVTRKELAGWHSEGIVTWLGHRDDIAQVLKEADIVALPSFGEGFPKGLIDAAAAGRPIVTTDIPGCRDAIIPGQSGLLIPKGDPAALADALQTLVENEELRLEMGRKGREMAEWRFGIETIVDAHFDLYEKALSSAQEETGR